MPVVEEGRFRVQHQGPLLASRGRLPWEEVADGPFVAFRPFTLHAVQYKPGDPVALDAAEPRILRNLYNARRIAAADAPEVARYFPAEPVRDAEVREGAPPTSVTVDTLASSADPVLEAAPEPVLEAVVEPVVEDVQAVAEAAPQSFRRKRGRPARARAPAAPE
jgi:hypothetical protein